MRWAVWVLFLFCLCSCGLLESGLERVSIPTERAKAEIDKADADGDGQITGMEMKAWFEALVR